MTPVSFPLDDDLDDDERAALHRSIEEGIEDFERGDTEDAFEFFAAQGTP